MDNRQPLQSGKIVGGDYRIESVLGAGGFGITYLAYDEKLGAKVALKEYFPATLASREDGTTVQPFQSQGGADYEWGLERFLAEAQTLARLRHPNIVSVSRYFRENATAYMVLGFVEGEDFETWLQKLGRAPTQEELDAIALPVLDALETVHAAGLVHRDVKPQNIYIRSEDGQPIVLDFGAARQALGEHSRATAAFVSPGYSPSESHLNDPTEQGPWTDIYSFAATLYRALMGRSPAQVLSRVSRDTYEPLATQLSNPEAYRPGFLSAIDNALNVRREDRPQSVAAWRAMLMSEPADDATVVSRPPSADDDKTRVVSGGAPTAAALGATRVAPSGNGQQTRREEPQATRRVGGPGDGSGDGGKPPTQPEAPQRGNGMRWLWAAAGAVLLIGGVVNIYQSFSGPTSPASTTQPVQPSQPAAPPPGTRDRATAPAQPNQTPDVGTMGADEVPNNGTLFAQDPSLRRLATSSWLSSGIQNGYWTAVTTGSKGTGIYLRCRGNSGLRRDSIVELEAIPTGNRPLSGNQEVQAQIGSYSTSAVLSFASANGFSNGSASVTETQETEGQFLNFLHQLFLGSTMTLTIPSTGYQENFNLNGAEEALNVCFGADVAQPWRSYVVANGVAGGEVRNANGAVLVVRCDTTPATRGNMVIAFSTPFNGTIQPSMRNIAFRIGNSTSSGNFNVQTRGGGLGGVLYQRANDNNSRQQVRNFLNALRNNSQFTLSSANPSFSETFSLNGSSRALSGCNGL